MIKMRVILTWDCFLGWFIACMLHGTVIPVFLDVFDCEFHYTHVVRLPTSGVSG